MAIFIDGSNLYHGLKETFNISDTRVDFNKLMELLKQNRTLVGAYYYNASLDITRNEQAYWKQQSFFSKLKAIPGFNVVVCHMRKTRLQDGSVRYEIKGDDINLAVDMLSLAYENKYDAAILVSGDGDFVPLVERVRSLGKNVTIACFYRGRSPRLLESCNNCLVLDSILKEHLVRK
ncbi:NYN domain-containing protein [Candidatus Micrarchaeota archaeon]|nr:NYN domain-containing protein [Candidatus Micrarchaeota archaeon]